MKLELNIDQATIGPTVKELFDTLTVEDRKELSRQIMEKFLAEPHNGERAAYEAATIAEIKTWPGDEYVYVQGHGSTRVEYKFMTDLQARSTDRFKKRMEAFKSTREIMISEITKTAVEAYRGAVTDYVQKDPQLQQVLAATIDAVKTDFPKFVHDALVGWFITNLQQQAGSMLQAISQSANAGLLAESVDQRLRARGI